MTSSIYSSKASRLSLLFIRFALEQFVAKTQTKSIYRLKTEIQKPSAKTHILAYSNVF